jgi:hypothetical protein
MCDVCKHGYIYIYIYIYIRTHISHGMMLSFFRLLHANLQACAYVVCMCVFVLVHIYIYTHVSRDMILSTSQLDEPKPAHTYLRYIYIYIYIYTYIYIYIHGKFPSKHLCIQYPECSPGGLARKHIPSFALFFITFRCIFRCFSRNRIPALVIL